MIPQLPMTCLGTCLLLSVVFALSGCEESRSIDETPSNTATGPSVGSEDPLATNGSAETFEQPIPVPSGTTKSPPVEIWLGLIKYDNGIAGLKVGDVAKFAGRISEESNGYVVVVHLADRYEEINFEVDPKPIPITASELSEAFGRNSDEAVKKYVVPLDSNEGTYVVEGTITELDGSLYKVILQ